MKIGIASDHAGYALKEHLKSFLAKKRHKIIDFGTDSADKPADYPDFAKKVAQAVIAGRVERAIIICGSGVGASVAANKIKGIRAGLCHDTYSAHQAVEHDDINILCLGSRIIGQSLAQELSAAFIKAKFSGERRHKKRLDKIEKLEREN